MSTKKKWYLLTKRNENPHTLFLQILSETPSEATHPYTYQHYFGPFSTKREALNAVNMMQYFFNDVSVTIEDYDNSIFIYHNPEKSTL